MVNHALCNSCWKILEPYRVPIRVSKEYREAEKCCQCGAETLSGIYYAKPVALNACKCSPMERS